MSFWAEEAAHILFRKKDGKVKGVCSRALFVRKRRRRRRGGVIINSAHGFCVNAHARQRKAAKVTRKKREGREESLVLVSPASINRFLPL